MNSDKDKFLSASREDEALGRHLSEGLRREGTGRIGECPGPEAIAAVVDGTADGDERERVLKHVSVCDNCYEMFLLTAELQKEEETRPETHTIVRWKTLAMAAGFLIVIFSLYVFYRSNEIPKTSRDMMDQSKVMKAAEVEKKSVDSGVEGGVVGGVEDGVVGDVEVSISPMAKTTTTSVTHQPEKPGTASKRERIDRDKNKENNRATAGEKKSAPAPLGFDEREEELKTAKKDAPTAPVEIPKEIISEEHIAQKGMPKKEMDSKEKEPEKKDTFTIDGIAFAAKQAPPERGKAGRQYKARRQVQGQLKETDESRRRQEVGVSKKMIQRQSNAPIQSQVLQLNVMAESVDSYLPRQELENLFKDSIVLSQQLGEEYETVRQNAVTTGNYNEVKTYEKGLKPIINLKTVGDKTYISPNIYWFYSRSAPRTVEHQFFSLARAGWCAAASQCYKEDKPTSRLVKSKKRSHLLVQWQALQPQLTGVFKDVATNTISQLEKTDK